MLTSSPSSCSPSLSLSLSPGFSCVLAHAMYIFPCTFNFVMAGVGRVGHISVRPLSGLSRPPRHPQIRRRRSFQQLLSLDYYYLLRGFHFCTKYFLGLFCFVSLDSSWLCPAFFLGCWGRSSFLVGWNIIARKTTPEHSIAGGFHPAALSHDLAKPRGS